MFSSNHFNNNQQTIKFSIEFHGKTSNNKKETSIKLLPDDEGTGISFLIDNKKISAYQYINSIKDKNSIFATQHLLASLWNKNISNCIIKLQDKEVPIMDKSASNFLIGIDSAGITEQNKLNNILTGKAYLSNNSYIEPHDHLYIELNFSQQSNLNKYCFDNNSMSFKEELSTAKFINNFQDKIKYKNLNEITKRNYMIRVIGSLYIFNSFINAKIILHDVDNNCFLLQIQSLIDSIKNAYQQTEVI